MKKAIIIIVSVVILGLIGVSTMFISNAGDELNSFSVSKLQDENFLIEIGTKKLS